MEWMLMPLRRYADFSGRSRRKEYWMFFLAYVLILAVTGILYEISHVVGGLIAAVVVLGLFIPSLAVQVRRFHDQDKSGWFVLLSIIPYIGGLIVLVFMAIDGTRGPNRFGEDPKGIDGLSDVFA